MEELKCLYCEADIVVDDTLDTNVDGSYVSMLKVGHCPYCEAHYQWNEYFEFDRFENLERC